MPEPRSDWPGRKGRWDGKDSRTGNPRGRARRPLRITKITFVPPGRRRRLGMGGDHRGFAVTFPGEAR